MDYIEICKENMALQQENKQLKEKLAIREKALELACEKAVLYSDSEQALDSMEYKHTVEYFKYYCITQAKESIDEDRN